MTEDTNTAVVNVEVSLPKDLKEVAEAYQKALHKINELYKMQLGGRIAGAITRARENRAWSEIVGVLAGCVGTLPEQSKPAFEESLRVLKGGIYDLYPLKIAGADDSLNELELIIGKVFLSSGGGEGYYSGVAGVCNRVFDQLIKKYDAQIPLFSERLGSLTGTREIKEPDEIPELRCLNIFSLSGGLNTEHKPICVFFSGGARENVSSLSNMTVFVNLYQSRFNALTQKIAESYIIGAPDLLGGLTKEDTARLLLTWLRGHDVGHFFGADNLGSVMSEFDMDYMILHELKSDMVSLYNLRYLDRTHLSGCSIDHAYMVAMAEMLRYIRRGGIYRHPDSGSAYLTYMALKDRGALIFDETTGKLSYDTGLLEEAVEECTLTLLELFLKGGATGARAYVNSWGELADSDNRGVPKSCPEELRTIINDSGIAHSISYVFKLV